MSDPSLIRFLSAETQPELLILLTSPTQTHVYFMHSILYPSMYIFILYILYLISDTTHRILQMIILPFIPILALIVQTSLTLQEILEYRADVADIETQVSKQRGMAESCPAL